MMNRPIGEIDLHAYVDRQLDTARRADVEGYLAAHPDTAAYVEQLRDQVQALHRSYDGILNEPVPARLTAVVEGRRWSSGLAAGIVWLACGLIVGWLVHGFVPARSASAAFAQNALTAHVLYVAERRHPVEVPADQEAHLVAWLSKRLDTPIRAPDLQAQGFALLGGRLLPGTDAPMAQLMYESTHGERLTLTVKHAARQQQRTGFQIMQERGISVFYWIDGDYGYALSGSIDRPRLLAVAHAVERQLQQ